MTSEERYVFALRPLDGGRVEIWTCIHVAPDDSAARTWLEESGMHPQWDAPLLGPPGRTALPVTGTIIPPAVAPRR